MSNNIQEWEDFDDDFEDDFEETQPQRRSSGDDVVKKLRRAERSQAKRIKELESELGSMRKSVRDSSVKNILEAKGISPKVAAFIPQDIDVESSAFDTWLEDYADVFGGASTKSGAAVDANDLAALRQIDNLTASATTPDRAEDILLRINQASSEEELLNLIYGGE